jgi:virulence-associated protein VagC
MKHKTASVFQTGRNQAVRPEGDTALVRRDGNAVILEPAQGWPEDYVRSFSGMPDDFERPPQGKVVCRSLTR